MLRNVIKNLILRKFSVFIFWGIHKAGKSRYLQGNQDCMNSQLFYQTIMTKSRETGINPLLLVSGIEGLYTFKDVPLNTLNYDFLDSLILTIFALRIGDQFHALAEENLSSHNETIRAAASVELQVLNASEIASSANVYLQSFARILDGKSTIRNYHQKALDVAALEIQKVLTAYGYKSIGAIILILCKDLSGPLNLGSFFAS